MVCPPCPHCDCESEYAGRDKRYYYFECSCTNGVYVVCSDNNGDFDVFHNGERK